MLDCTRARALAQTNARTRAHTHSHTRTLFVVIRNVVKVEEHLVGGSVKKLLVCSIPFTCSFIKHSHLCDNIYICVTIYVCVTIETGAPQGRHACVPPAPSANSGGLSGAAAAAAGAAAARLQLAATHNTLTNAKKTHDGFFFFFFFFFFFSRTCPLHSSRASPSSSAAQWAPAATCSQVRTPNITTGFMY